MLPSPPQRCHLGATWHAQQATRAVLKQRCARAGLGVQVGPNVSTGNGLDFLAGRLSYVFNLAGPCLATHTACSSSLVALHLAGQGRPRP